MPPLIPDKDTYSLTHTHLKNILSSLCSFGFALGRAALSTHLQFLFLEIHSQPLNIVSNIWMVWNIISAFAEPIIGAIKIGSTPQRSAKQKLDYIWYCVPIYCILFLGLWNTISILNHFQITFNSHLGIAYFSLNAIVFSLVDIFIGLNLGAITPALYPTPKLRETISGYRQFFSVLGLILGVPAPIILSNGWKDLKFMSYILTSLVFLSFFISIITMNGILNVLMSWKTEPRDVKTVKIDDNTKVSKFAFLYSWIFEMKDLILEMESFRWYLLVQFFVFFGSSLAALSISLFTKYVVNPTHDEIISFGSFEFTLSPDNQTALALSSIYIISLISSPLWMWILDKLGVIATFQLGILTHIASALYMYQTTTGFWSGLVACSLSGPTLPPFFTCPEIMLGDLFDDQELRYNKRNEGMFYGTNGLFVRIPGLIASALFNIYLSSHAYDSENSECLPNQDDCIYGQPRSVIGAIRNISTLYPSIFYFIAFLLLFMYPLRGSKLEEMRKTLQLKKKSKVE